MDFFLSPPFLHLINLSNRSFLLHPFLLVVVRARSSARRGQRALHTLLSISCSMAFLSFQLAATQLSSRGFSFRLPADTDCVVAPTAHSQAASRRKAFL
jgi:hypothetical protein